MRRYEAAFISKLNDAEAEAAETQTWLEFAVTCGYLAPSSGKELHQVYDRILGTSCRHDKSLSLLGVAFRSEKVILHRFTSSPRLNLLDLISPLK